MGNYETRKRMVGPRAYLEPRPTYRSIKFGGRFVNLKALARDHHFNHSYITRIIKGSRTASVDYCRRVAAALDMPLEDFLQAVDDLRDDIRAELLKHVS